VLDDGNLAQHADALAQIGQSLMSGGDLQLYGCDVASGASGQQFIADLSHYAGGADVAAATHLVGDAALGGSWTLDASTGPIGSSSPFTPQAQANFQGLLANTLTATQSTTLTTDADGDSDIGPGDTVTTSVTITNNSTTTNATGVSFDETLSGMTLVNGSIKITPIAFDDSYSNIVGNTPITISAANGVLANDVDLNGAGLTAINVIQSDAATHGTVVLNSDGSFTYTPDTGFAGTATFQYTAHDALNLDSVTTGTVTLNVTDPIWYVDSSASAGGDGSFGHAFQTVGGAVAAAAANTHDPNGAVNDTIFVYNRGSTYSQASGITLANGEQLLGDGSSLTTVNGNTVGASSANPNFQDTGNSTTAVTLNQNNTIAGINISNTGTSGNGIADNGGTVGTLHFIGIGVSTNGNGISLTHGGTVDATGTNTISSTGGVALNITNTAISATGVTFHDISATGGSNGIVLVNTGSSGGLTVTGTIGSTSRDNSGGTIQSMTGADGTSAGHGIYLSGTSNVSLSHMNIHNVQGDGIHGNGVTNFGLSYTTLASNGTTTAQLGNFHGEGDVQFVDLTGAASIDNNFLNSANYNTFAVFNETATDVLNRLVMTNNTFAANDAMNGNNGVALQSQGGTMNVTFNNNTITGAGSNVFVMDMHGVTAADLIMHNNAISNNHPNITTGGGGV
jgi:hypothetical protein